jgi:hypothetical protein
LTCRVAPHRLRRMDVAIENVDDLPRLDAGNDFRRRALEAQATGEFRLGRLSDPAGWQRLPGFARPYGSRRLCRSSPPRRSRAGAAGQAALRFWTSVGLVVAGTTLCAIRSGWATCNCRPLDSKKLFRPECRLPNCSAPRVRGRVRVFGRRERAAIDLATRSLPSRS